MVIGALLVCAIATMALIPRVYASHNAYAMPLVAAAIALAVASLRSDPLRQLLIVWFGGMLFGLSVAGEKMPWLTLHLVVPLIFLSGLTIRDLLISSAAASIGHNRRSCSFSLRSCLALQLSCRPPGDPGAMPLTLLSSASPSVWLLCWNRGWHPFRPGFGLAVFTAMVLGLLAPLSLRTSFVLSYQHGDTPYEALVYTQTSPDLPKILDDVQQYARQSGAGYSQPIVVNATDAFSWPWAWYLRDYHATSFVDLSAYLSGQSDYRPPANAIMLVNNSNRPLMERFQGQFGAGIPYHHRWWFPEDYRGTTAAGLFDSLRDGTTWARWWGLLVGAHDIVLPDVPPSPGVHPIGTVDAIAYFPADYTPGTGILPAASRVSAPKAGANGALRFERPRPGCRSIRETCRHRD